MNYNLVILTVFGLIASALCDIDCPSFTNCKDCYAQNSGGIEVCGWCASDANGGGSCIQATNTQDPVTPCPNGYWNFDCCSQYTSCDDCSTSNAHCQWCESGSSVNGNKCIPYNNILLPQLGGCDLPYYTNNCCGDYTTCDTCSTSGKACSWCQKGSSVNGGSCLPFDNSLNPMWGGCDADYYTNVCCQDMKTCTDCVSKGWNCNWCGDASTVNPSECLPFNNALDPMYGGCDGGNFTNVCSASFISF